MAKRSTLVRKSTEAAAKSRAIARRAKKRIDLSRKRLSHSEDVVVATASRIGGARWAMRRGRKINAG